MVWNTDSHLRDHDRREQVDAKAVGDDQIVWTLSTPYPDFKYALASQFMGIHPKKQIEAKSPVEYFKKPVSAGPLMLTEWTPGTDLMVLKANPHYWGKAAVQEVRITVIPDATSRLLALQRGSVDYVYTLPLTAKDQVDKSKVRVFSQAEPGTFMLAVNNYAGQPNEALKDKKVRQAMSLVLDRKKMADIVFFGIAEPACAFAFKPSNPYFACSLPNNGAPDVAGARARLAETRWARGFQFEMIVPARPQWAEAAQVLASDLARIGITAKIVPLPDADISTAGHAPLPEHNLFDARPANDWMKRVDEPQPETRRLFGDFWLEGELAILFADTGLGKSISPSRSPNPWLAAVRSNLSRWNGKRPRRPTRLSGKPRRCSISISNFRANSSVAATAGSRPKTEPNLRAAAFTKTPSGPK